MSYAVIDDDNIGYPKRISQTEPMNMSVKTKDTMMIQA